MDKLIRTVFHTVPGDANLDRLVDSSDAAIMSAHWGDSNMTWLQGDFNGDGSVDGGDQPIFNAYTGANCTVAPSAPITSIRASMA